MNFLVFLLILSLMMVLHELGHFVTAKLFKITVLEFGLGLPPRAWGFRAGGVMYSLNWIPFGAFVKMLGEEDPTAPGSFAGKSRWVRAIVLAAGSGMNFLLAVVAFSIAMMIGTPDLTVNGPVKVGGISRESPAEVAGLQRGDTITTVDGQTVNVEQFRALAQTKAGQSVALNIQRGSESVQTSLTPRANPPEGQGAVGVLLGSNALAQMGPIEAVGTGFSQTVRVISTTVLLPKMLIQGEIAPSDARMVGLPGMASLTSQTVDYARESGLLYPLFILVGVFSAGLSIANMLPIPALDGGRLLFVIIEAVRGRRISPEREATVHFVGIVALLALMIVISVNDIIFPAPNINWGLR